MLLPPAAVFPVMGPPSPKPFPSMGPPALYPFPVSHYGPPNPHPPPGLPLPPPLQADVLSADCVVLYTSPKADPMIADAKVSHGSWGRGGEPWWGQGGEGSQTGGCMLLLYLSGITSK